MKKNMYLKVLVAFLVFGSFSAKANATYVCSENGYQIEFTHPDNNAGTFLNHVGVYLNGNLLEQFDNLKGQFDSSYGPGPNGEMAFIFSVKGRHLKSVWHGTVSDWYIYDLDGTVYDTWKNGPEKSTCIGK